MLSEDQFQGIISSKDVVVISIRGHIAIESALSEVISKGLPESHQLEVKKLSFPLKVDLAVALKGLANESRPLFMKLNSIRNNFAHQYAAELDTKSIKELKSCMSSHQRAIVGHHFDDSATARYALIMATTAAFYEANAASERLLNKKLHQDALIEEVRLLIDRIDPERKVKSDGDFSKRVQDRVKVKRLNQP